MNTITRDELKNMLIHSKGANFCTILAVTAPKLIKGAPFNNLLKLSEINGTIGANYEKAVNRQRNREGIEEKFETQKRAWGTRIENSPVITHNNSDYLELKVERSLAKYFMDGEKVIPTEVVKPYLVISKSAKQEVEREIILRDFKFDNLRTIRINGKEFSIA